jgi:hypothetical protein
MIGIWGDCGSKLQPEIKSVVAKINLLIRIIEFIFPASQISAIYASINTALYINNNHYFTIYNLIIIGVF